MAGIGFADPAGRARETEPGRHLGPNEAPRLWSVAREVAHRLGTRPVDAIYLTPGTGIAVIERGNIWRKLLDAGERCLILGLGSLPGMSQAQLKAIFAHEYGHFSNRDTAGGNVALLVRSSIDRMAFGLVMSNQARWYNPAWLFVNGFKRMFLRVTLGASRLQEILADRSAAAAYGARNLIGGLRHVIRQSLVFDAQVKGEIESALREKRPLGNIYLLPPPQVGEHVERIEAIEMEYLERTTGPYDSHPALRERVALLESLASMEDGADSSAGVEPAAELLGRLDSFHAEMTAAVEESVRRHHG